MFYADSVHIRMDKLGQSVVWTSMMSDDKRPTHVQESNQSPVAL